MIYKKFVVLFCLNYLAIKTKKAHNQLNCSLLYLEAITLNLYHSKMDFISSPNLTKSVILSKD